MQQLETLELAIRNNASLEISASGGSSRQREVPDAAAEYYRRLSEQARQPDRQ